MSEPAGDGPAARGWLVVYLKGVAMGAADAVPGVSGGTIALITGIYERLVDAIAGLPEGGPDVLAAMVGSGGTDRVTTSARTLVAMDVPFLVVLALGVLTGVATVANLIDVALESYRATTYAVFFGIILASPVVLRGEVAVREPRPLAAGLVGVVLAFWVGGLPGREADYALPALFLVGAVAICAMVLPGISGSLVLVVIGAYDAMTGAVGDLTRATLGGGLDAAVAPATTLAAFAAGALVGVLAFARVVSRALDADRVTTMTFLVGVMLGALRAPAREIVASVGRPGPAVALALLAAAVVGALVVLSLAYITGGIEPGPGSGRRAPPGR